MRSVVEDDTKRFGTPERYLQGIGVDVLAGEYVTFSRGCPNCRAYNQLDEFVARHTKGDAT